MFKAFFGSKEYKIWAWSVLTLLLGLTVAQVYLNYQFNNWYGEFYNILEQKDAAGFGPSIFKFSWMAGISILLSTASFYVSQHFSFRWREALTKNYLPRWAAITTEYYEGSSQRIQEDTMRFARILESLGLGTFKAVLTLIAFIPMLWGFSAVVKIPYFDVPGSLVWIALVTSIGGMIISWFVGYRLPRLEYNNQKVEAAFRKELVYGEDNKAQINVANLLELFTGVRTNYFALFNAYKWFTVWQTFYFQAAIILPFLVGAPSFFAGVITLGVLVQISNAFDKVHGSFSYFLDNWLSVNELRSINRRLNEFESVLPE